MQGIRLESKKESKKERRKLKGKERKQASK